MCRWNSFAGPQMLSLHRVLQPPTTALLMTYYGTWHKDIGGGSFESFELVVGPLFHLWFHCIPWVFDWIGIWASGLNWDLGGQQWSAEKCIVIIWSLTWTSLERGFNVVADSCTNSVISTIYISTYLVTTEAWKKIVCTQNISAALATG